MDALIIDDKPMCLEILSSILSNRYPAASIRTADGLGVAFALIAERGPSLVIADISVPDIYAVTGLQRLVDHVKPCPILVLDARFNAANLERAYAAGARGYVTGTSTRDLVEAAIGLVAAGGTYFPHAVDGPRPRNEGRHPLSKRQIEVLEGVMQGKANREIATDLGITVATVKLHVHAILSATGARNRTEAALRAREYLLRTH